MTKGQLKTRCNQLVVSFTLLWFQAGLRGKLERNQMAEVHGITTWSTAGVEVKGELLLVSI